MVRTIKAKASRSLKKGERTILLPGATGAEPWEVWIMGSTAPECVQTSTTPLENRLRKGALFALPASQVFCLPLWLNELDPKQIADFIPLQIELRGLQVRGNGPAIFDWEVIARDGARTLVMAAVLPASLPNDFHVEAYNSFDLSARLFVFPENALTLWQEQDQFAVAVTRGPNLAYFQSLGSGPITASFLQDLRCIQTTLLMQGVATSLQKVVVWAKISPEEHGSLQDALQLPVEISERPAPRLPTSPWKLMPAIVGQVQKSRVVQRLRNRTLLTALAVYLILVSVLLTRFLITSLKVNELQSWKAAHAQSLALVRDTRAAWKELGPVVNEKDYPLELLLHTSQAIPADDLHLTLFEANDGHLLIKGEAKNVAAAFQFLDHLKSDPHFAGYAWNMGQPQVMPNDLARLQIEGIRAN